MCSSTNTTKAIGTAAQATGGPQHVLSVQDTALLGPGIAANHAQFILICFRHELGIIISPMQNQEL